MFQSFFCKRMVKSKLEKKPSELCFLTLVLVKRFLFQQFIDVIERNEFKSKFRFRFFAIRCNIKEELFYLNKYVGLWASSPTDPAKQDSSNLRDPGWASICYVLFFLISQISFSWTRSLVTGSKFQVRNLQNTRKI